MCDRWCRRIGRYTLTENDYNSRQAAWWSALEDRQVPIFRREKITDGSLTLFFPLNTSDPRYATVAASWHIDGRSLRGLVVNAREFLQKRLFSIQ
jgi:hypothetical protein